jgi:hypothetical protein
LLWEDPEDEDPLPDDGGRTRPQRPESLDTDASTPVVSRSSLYDMPLLRGLKEDPDDLADNSQREEAKEKSIEAD